METFIKKNIGIFMFYLVLIGGILLINARFDKENNSQGNLIAINK